jgi:hypothetical protein
MDTLLKWKFTHLNSVDFLFKLVWKRGSPPEAKLFVGGERGDLIPVDEPSVGLCSRCIQLMTHSA